MLKIAFLLLLFGTPVPARSQVSGSLQEACKNEISVFCEGQREEALAECLRENRKGLMYSCRNFLDETGRLEKEKAALALQPETGAVSAALLSEEVKTEAAPATQAVPAEFPAPGSVFTFRGVKYFNRAVLNNLSEFTPKGQEDLSGWEDMLSISKYQDVNEGERLALTANNLLDIYTGSGAMLLKTDSVPATADKPAEHFISVMFGRPDFLEAVFARLKLVDGVGYAMIYSHRIYGKHVGDRMSAWLEEHGPVIEEELMAWEGTSEPANPAVIPSPQVGLSPRFPVWAIAAAGMAVLAAAGFILRRLRRKPRTPVPAEEVRRIPGADNSLKTGDIPKVT